MKIYADIIMSGPDFDPEYYMKKFNVYFRNYNKRGDYNKRLNVYEKEGYGILTNDDNDTTVGVISKVISLYEKIKEEVENKINYKEFNLIIESVQNSFTVSLDYFVMIQKYFSTINISYIEEDSI